MKLKKKLARQFSGTDAFVPEARMTNNKLNRELTLVENAYLAGFEKAREMAQKYHDDDEEGYHGECYATKFLRLGEEEV